MPYTMQDALDWFGDTSLGKALVKARYGKSLDEKAARLDLHPETIPGYKKPLTEADRERETRRLSGVEFGEEHPLIARGGVGVANFIRRGEVPGFKDPPNRIGELHNAAIEGASAGSEPRIREAYRNATKTLGQYIPPALAVGLNTGLSTLNEALAPDRFKTENINESRQGAEEGFDESIDEPFAKLQPDNSIKWNFNHLIPGHGAINLISKGLRKLPFTY